MNQKARAGGSVPAFLTGGGEAGALMRAHDWSATPVGPISRWPGSLRTAVGIIINSRHPMFLWWGPDLIQFYNDAYIPCFGKGKHPAAMGQQGAECWQEIWPIVFPQIDAVMSHGAPSWNEDHLVPIYRNGRIEEVYWTYGYSPVFDDDGGVGGTLVVCTETTSRVLGERRLRARHDFAERAALAVDAEALIAAAAEIVEGSPGDMPFACFYATDWGGGAPRLLTTAGIAGEAAAAVDLQFRSQLRAMAESGHPHPLQDRGTSRVRDDVAEVFVAPIQTTAQQAPSGFALVGLSPRQTFDEAYRDHLIEFGRDIAHSQARIAAFQLRAAVESERNSLLQQAPVATAVMAGPHHVFQLANPLYLQLVGRKDVVGQSYLEAFPELASTPLPGILDRVYQTGVPFVTNEMHIPLERNDAGVVEDRYVKFNLEPMRDVGGHVYGMMAVAVDITAQVTARHVLEKAQAERDALLQELERASRAKDEFLAMLGHELRNPLSPILTALQLMRMRGERRADREREIIERQVQHLVTLVDDLLDISRITQAKIHLRRERLSVSDVVANAIEMASPLIEHRRHRLTVEVPDELVIEGDAARLAQIVANLLTNAAKYTEPEGHILVRADTHAGQVRLMVRDNGIGIAPELLPHVFDAFTQERQSSARSKGGLGLGLAIVRSLVSMHGGTIVLQSGGVGRGTECVVRLPAPTDERVEAPALVESASPEASAEVREVLVVDDNEDAAETLVHALRALGHRVQVASDAPEALKLASDYVPDVALLDLGLPVIDGCELAQRLRHQPGWNGVRLIALTGYGLESDRQRTRHAGFDAHLVKPIDLDTLNSALLGVERADAEAEQNRE